MSGTSTAKMVVEVYENKNYSKKTKQYAVLFNPASYGLEWDFKYAQKPALSGHTLFSGICDIKNAIFGITLIFDGTGVGAAASGKNSVSAMDELWDFLEKATPLNRDGSRKRLPPYCRLVWGNLCIRCVVQKVKANVELVASDGKLLRVKLDTTFQSITPERMLK